jgi:four helix bundle protein
VDATEEICKPLKGKLSFSILDQMTRASLSIPLNIAEGSGRWHKKEKIQFLRIARGSVFEIVPIIEIMRRRRFLDFELYKKSYGELQIMAKMLTGFINSIEEKEIT